MKKPFAAAFLSLAAVGLSSGDASAGLFDCIHCKKGACTITVRPYNAFSPVCSGSICCDGCIPLAQNNYAQQAWYGGCADGAVISDAHVAPAAPLPAAPKFQGPMPSPAPAAGPATSQFPFPQQVPYGYGMAYGNGYQPPFIPNYGPIPAPQGLPPYGYGYAPGFGR